MVKVDRVSLTYHEPHAETLALQDICFSIKNREFVAIVGPSGCGKSTMLSLIAGLIAPSSGTISFPQFYDTERSSVNIGYMLQSDHLFDWRSIERNITLGLEVCGIATPENKQRAHDLLNTYGLGSFAHYYPRQLSGGMRQKVALIRTLAVNPQLLLLDEPFSSLDYQTRLSVSDEIHQIIRNEHKTAILVTHDIAEAISMADRVLVFSARPSYVKAEHEIMLTSEPSPIARRNAPEFKNYFDLIWKELDLYAQK